MRLASFTIVAGPSDHQQAYGNALADGCRAHGVRVNIVGDTQQVTTPDCACWGWHGGARLRMSRREVLVLERGYLGDRFSWTSLGWNGLNNRAAALVPDDGGARFRENFGHLLRPWNPVGDYALVIGQVPGDASLSGRSLVPWYESVAQAAKIIWGLPVRYRPHPQAVKRGFTSSVQAAPTLDGSLADAIAGARVVITWNSNTAVESVLAGKPTIAFDEGSMAWDVCCHQMADNTDEPAREAWAARLAWRQWTIEEIRSGAAWAIVGRPIRENPASPRVSTPEQRLSQCP